MPVAIKIVVPDAGPLNTLAAADLLPLLLAPRNVTLVLVDAVVREIVAQADVLTAFIRFNKSRIEIAETAVERNIQTLLKAGMKPDLRGSGENAIADFMVHGIDDVASQCPALVLYEDRKMPRFRRQGLYSERVHLMTTAAYLLKLEEAGVIASFVETWQRIVGANHADDPELDRSPNSEVVEYPADGGSAIVFEP